MAAKQWVAIDDVDSRIQYLGGWFAVKPDLDINGLGNFGTPFQNTLHGIKENGNFTFAFTGSAVNVLGTTNITEVGGVQDPSYECLLDGNAIPINKPLPIPENNWLLCTANGLAVGQHTLTVRATVDKMTFWLDRVQYVPASDSEYDKQLNYLENDHPSVTYDSGWSDLRGVADVTQTNGAKATISFTGRSLAWYGLVPIDYPLGAAPATFSVDKGTPQNFQLNGLPPASTLEQYNQLFFQTPQLPPGDHTVEVVYGGNLTLTPLTLDYFIVQREGAVANTDTSIPTPTPTPRLPVTTGGSASRPIIFSSESVIIYQTQTVTNTPAPTKFPSSHTSNENNSTPVGVIVGGIIGGIVLLTLLGWFIIVRCCAPSRRHRDRQRLLRGRMREPPRAPTLPVVMPLHLDGEMEETTGSLASGKMSGPLSRASTSTVPSGVPSSPLTQTSHNTTHFPMDVKRRSGRVMSGTQQWPGHASGAAPLTPFNPVPFQGPGFDVPIPGRGDGTPISLDGFDTPSSGDGSVTPRSRVGPDTPTSRVVEHKDGGVRLQMGRFRENINGGEGEEMPPRYSPV